MGETMANQAEMDDEAYTDTFPFDVHFCVSRGRCAYTFEEVKPSEGGFAVTISQENSNKFASATFTEAQVSEFQKYFEEEAGPQELEGNCFCTIESQPEHALEELKFLADKGKGRKPPSRDEVTEPIFKQDMTGGDEWRYFVSLFDLSVFEDDPVSKAWVDKFLLELMRFQKAKFLCPLFLLVNFLKIEVLILLEILDLRFLMVPLLYGLKFILLLMDGGLRNNNLLSSFKIYFHNK